MFCLYAHAYYKNFKISAIETRKRNKHIVDIGKEYSSKYIPLRTRGPTKRCSFVWKTIFMITQKIIGNLCG